MPTRHLNHSEQLAIYSLHRAGFSIKKIGPLLNLTAHISTIYRLIKRIEKSNSSQEPTQHNLRERSHKFNHKEKIRLRNLTLKNRFATKKQLQDLVLKRRLLPNVSMNTIVRTLHSSGLHQRVSRQKVYTNDKHREEQVRWCLEHQLWDEEDWDLVIFQMRLVFLPRLHRQGAGYGDIQMRPTCQSVLHR